MVIPQKKYEVKPLLEINKAYIPAIKEGYYIDIDGVIVTTLLFKDAENSERMKQKNDMQRLYQYLIKTPNKPGNLILFVNGYRNNLNPVPDFFSEMSRTNNSVTYNSDLTSYWEGTDKQFITAIKTENAVYADGNHSVSTANHGSVAAFTANMVAAKAAYPLKELTQKACMTDVVGPLAFNLHTVPNLQGFKTRKENGRFAGERLLERLNSGLIPIAKDAKGKITGKLDIVAHSMGFAYSLGMIEVLRGKVPFGNFYIIAPENAGSGTVNVKEFENVWQYGSNEKEEYTCEQDGVAPQTSVGGLTNFNRILIETKAEDLKDKKEDFKHHFVESHLVKNYKWIFDRGIRDRGYVFER